MTSAKIIEHLIEQFHLPKEQIEAMLPSFISALSSHLKGLDAAVQTEQPQEIGKAGHKIKGACLNLGLLDCAKIALDIETLGKAGEIDVDYGALVHQLQQKINPLLE